MSSFQHASKVQSYFRGMIYGPSGSGKTWTALLIARALLEGTGKRIALLDTEFGDSAKYAGEFDFDVCTVNKFSPEDFIGLMAEAVQAGVYGALIIDSASHEWEGTPGGCKPANDALAQAKFNGNTWAAWSHTTPRHDRFIHAFKRLPMHFIACYRSKSDWVKGDNQKVGTKVGLAPVARDNTEYDFDVALQLSMEHDAVVSKSRINHKEIVVAVGAVIEKPGRELGQTIGKWLASGAAQEARALEEGDAGAPNTEQPSGTAAAVVAAGGERGADAPPAPTAPPVEEHETPPPAKAKANGKTPTKDEVLGLFTRAGGEARKKALAATNYVPGKTSPMAHIEGLDDIELTKFHEALTTA